MRKTSILTIKIDIVKQRDRKIAANHYATQKGARWKWHGSLGEVKVRYFAPATGGKPVKCRGSP